MLLNRGCSCMQYIHEIKLQGKMATALEHFSTTMLTPR